GEEVTPFPERRGSFGRVIQPLNSDLGSERARPDFPEFEPQRHVGLPSSRSGWPTHVDTVVGLRCTGLVSDTTRRGYSGPGPPLDLWTPATFPRQPAHGCREVQLWTDSLVGGKSQPGC